MKIFSNAKTYNLKNTIYYKCAAELEEYGKKILLTLKEDYQKEDHPDKEEKKKKVK